MQTSKTLEQEHARSEASTWEGILQKETFFKLTRARRCLLDKRVRPRTPLPKSQVFFSNASVTVTINSYYSPVTVTEKMYSH